MEHSPPYHPLYLNGFSDADIELCESSWEELRKSIPYLPVTKDEYFRFISIPKTNTLKALDLLNFTNNPLIDKRINSTIKEMEFVDFKRHRAPAQARKPNTGLRIGSYKYK